MNKRLWALIAGLLYGAVVLALSLVDPLAEAPGADDSKKHSADGIFGLAKVHAFHLEITAKEWEKMQPVGGGRGFPEGLAVPAVVVAGFLAVRAGQVAASPAAPGGPERPAGTATDVHRGSGFGMEFPWAHGTLTEDGKTYKNVGVRYKGNASYMASARGLKRNFKIELDHYDTDLRFHGLKSINLNAGAMDPTKAREALSYAVFRAAGVPAPRTAFAEVTLTVAGKYDQEYLGLYTFVEQVDKTFLKDRFQNSKGLLMKPERLHGVEYLGDDWDRYKAQYRPKHEPSKKEARRVIAFAKLVHQADDEQFRKEIGSYLDVDEFLRFVAGNALLANLDSIFTMGHNYYIYLNPATDKFVFIPWDLDLSLAGFPMAGPPDQQTDLSLTHPYPGQHKLINRLLAIQDVSAKYQKLLKELAATCFTRSAQLRQNLDAIEQATKGILAEEAKAAAARHEGPGGFGGPPGMFGRSLDLRTFIDKRTESVAAQLAGKSKGFIPAMGFGPGGRPGGPGGPGGFGPGNFLARPLLEALDADKDGKLTKEELVAGIKKLYKESDKGGRGSLDEETLAAAIGRVFPPPGGFGPPGGGPGGPGGPGPGGFPGGPPGDRRSGFGPNGVLARGVMSRADKDHRGRVTLDELVAAAEALFKEVDKEKKGKLDEGAVAAGINLLFPRPGFGPPGFGPPGERPEQPRKDDPKEKRP